MPRFQSGNVKILNAGEFDQEISVFSKWWWRWYPTTVKPNSSGGRSIN